MPVSTRSQFSHEQIDSTIKIQTGHKEPILGIVEDASVRGFHHGLKEKMDALTMLFEQQQKQAASGRYPFTAPNEKKLTTHPSVDLLSSHKKENNVQKPMGLSCNFAAAGNTFNGPSVASRTAMLPRNLRSDETKENMVMTPDCASLSKNSSRRLARKLSMIDPIFSHHHPQQQQSELLREGINSKRVEAFETDDGEKATIMVFVRLRPMSRKEKEEGSRCCVKIANRSDVYLTEFLNENDYLRLKRVRGRHFTFDSSFPDSTSQVEVYSSTTCELVEAVLQGKNGSVFCYGATGAGKTYTMLGTLENPGVMVLAIKDLFSKIRQRSYDGNHNVHLSYLEVYNDTVRDLLSPGRPLVLREDKQGIVAAGLTQYKAYSTDEVMALLQRGNLNRTTEPTRVNETSSRSHAILQVTAEYRLKDGSMNVINRVGKLSLIDLAGSERAMATEQRSLRSIEGANINKSLLALSSCINALVEGKKHIPYRNSKLTQLLKDSLGGSCNTVMIANISPSNLSFGETQNTLHWADRAKQIRTKRCEVNEEMQPIPEAEADQNKLLVELQKENRELKTRLGSQKQKMMTMNTQNHSMMSPLSAINLNETRKRSKAMEMEKSVMELKETIKALEMEIRRLKTDHASEIKQRDDIIRTLSHKRDVNLEARAVNGSRKAVTQRTSRPKEPNTRQLQSPSTRFKSPNSTLTKKRSFWDITTGNSPSVQSQGRKLRSRAIVDTVAAPSLLLKPGFARKRLDHLK